MRWYRRWRLRRLRARLAASDAHNKGLHPHNQRCTARVLGKIAWHESLLNPGLPVARTVAP